VEALPARGEGAEGIMETVHWKDVSEIKRSVERAPNTSEMSTSSAAVLTASKMVMRPSKPEANAKTSSSVTCEAACPISGLPKAFAVQMKEMAKSAHATSAELLTFSLLGRTGCSERAAWSQGREWR
jgi:hypothetical protein